MGTLIWDVETYKKGEEILEPILDGSGANFTLGCIHRDFGKDETFYNRKKMWERILELGEKEHARGKRLFIYGHNSRYEFYNLANLKDPNIVWFCENPFIASYMKEMTKEFKDIEKLKKWQSYAKIEHIRYNLELIEGVYKVTYKKEIIKFLDTMSLYRMSLKKMGEIIGCPKTEMPLVFKDNTFKRDNLKQMAEYCMNDCIVTMEGVKKIKEKLKEDGLHIRNLCTINQLAINYVINRLRKMDSEHILSMGKGGLTPYTHKTKFANEIHQAYRASLTRVWKVGKFDNVYYSDKNSLYPYAMTQIDIPDLRTERKIIHPKKDVLKEIGISKVMLKNETCDIGLIPIRTGERSYVPLAGKYMIGIYTNMEILKAIKSGYKLIKIEWSVIYDKGENILKPIFKELYKKRMEGGTEFNKFFYKSIMNSSIGKLGQRRVNQELCVDSIENIENYLKYNGEVIRGIDGTTNVLYKLVLDGRPKSYYAPIIPALVTAYARIYMYNIFKKVGKDRLLYSDTDSCISIGDHSDKIILNKKLDGWKFEKDMETGEELKNTQAIIWGSKAKSVGNNITVAGAFKSDLNHKEFDKGIVRTKRMMGIKNNTGRKAGEIIIEEKDLRKQKENFLKSEELLKKETLYIDKDIDDVSYFLDEISCITS